MSIKLEGERILIPGGAGFIGSNLAKYFVRAGAQVTVIDGLMPGTGSDIANLQDCLPKLRFIKSRIEKVKDLRRLAADSDIIIDAMAFTFHLKAIEKPLYDLELNAASHIHLLQALKGLSGMRIVFFGSRCQYGNPKTPVITETTLCEPVDVQGISKTAAEAYYRVYSKLQKHDVLSLRLANCFGVNQCLAGDELGLIGSFLKEIYSDRPIEIYGHARRRNVIYAGDISGIITPLLGLDLKGFHAFNYAGRSISIGELAQSLIRIIGRGKCIFKPMPANIKAIDVGNARLDDTKLRKAIGRFPETDIPKALEMTVRYYERRFL